MSVKLLLHSWTLAEGPVVRLLPQNSGFLAGHHAAARLALAGENDPSDEWRAIAGVMDQRGGER